MTTRTSRVAAALGIALLVALIAVAYGWQTLVDYINPKDATGRKNAVQVYALIVAGVIASITAAVGLLNLRLTRKNLEQQRDLEAQRAQGTALQAYYEQMGKLITEHKLRSTPEKDIRELARGQTLTVLRVVDGNGKGSLLTFLYSAGLIGSTDPALRAEDPIVVLTGADLHGADLEGAFLQYANLRGAFLQYANLRGAFLLGANLQKADLQGADLQGADLMGAFLQRARNLDQKQIERAIGDHKTTLLPEGLHPPEMWSKSREEQKSDLMYGDQ